MTRRPLATAAAGALGVALAVTVSVALLHAELFAWGASADLAREWGPVEPRPAGGRRVVLVSVDGLAPRLLAPHTAPVLSRLAHEGLRAEHAETVLPSRTLPAHVSMLSGLPPEEHGVLWNRYAPWRQVRVPTVFATCREGGLRCGLFAGKAKLAHLAEEEPGVERFALRPDAAAVLEAARAYAAARDPDLVVVHLAEVDRAGHDAGWESPAQRAALARVDRLLGGFLAGLGELGSGRLAVLVTADHGGQGMGHGSGRPEDVRIPWILWGEGIPAGTLDARVSTLDTAPTLLALLGLEAPPQWRGRARAIPPPPSPGGQP